MGPALAPRMRCLTASDVCTARALHPEITRHEPVLAITSDLFPQYEVAPLGYCRTAPANSKTVIPARVSWVRIPPSPPVIKIAISRTV
jgi:hypothetical protein